MFTSNRHYAGCQNATTDPSDLWRKAYKPKLKGYLITINKKKVEEQNQFSHMVTGLGDAFISLQRNMGQI